MSVYVYECVCVCLFEKRATAHKPKLKLPRCKTIVNIATFNLRNLNRVKQLPEQKASAAEHNTDIICVLEHRYYHCDLEIKYDDTGKG